MRCGCPHCGSFMIQEEEPKSACACPHCSYRCNACLGTGTALTRDEILKLKDSDWFSPAFDGESVGPNPEDISFTESEYPDAPRGF